VVSSKICSARVPSMDPAAAYQIFCTYAYSEIKYIIEEKEKRKNEQTRCDCCHSGALTLTRGAGDGGTVQARTTEAFSAGVGRIVPRQADPHSIGTGTIIIGAARAAFFPTISLTGLARERKAAPADLTGGTITITNVGGFGVETGTPIINRPECAILATGLIAPRPWVVDGQLAVRQLMTTAVSFDHRIVDGAYAARFLAHLRDLLEDPALLSAF